MGQRDTDPRPKFQNGGESAAARCGRGHTDSGQGLVASDQGLALLPRPAGSVAAAAAALHPIHPRLAVETGGGLWSADPLQVHLLRLLSPRRRLLLPLTKAQG